MTKELNEDTTFKMSVKTMGMIAAGIAVVVAGWYSLMAEIQEAKETLLNKGIKTSKTYNNQQKDEQNQQNQMVEESE